MRQLDQYDPHSESRISRIAPAQPAAVSHADAPRPRAAVARAVRRNNSAAVRAILAAVLVILLAMLAYLMSLSSRPSITELSPKPGSVSKPGLVTVEARVGASKPIQQVTLSIDGINRTPAVTTLGDRSWVVRFESVLPKGTHQAIVKVEDTKGGVQTHSWSFMAAGPRISPTITFTDPPADATLPEGLLWIHADVKSDADIASATMTINNQEMPVTLKPVDSNAQNASTGETTSQVWSIGTEHAFPAGSYSGHVVATDSQGDKSEAQFHFNVTNNSGKANTRYFSASNLYVSGQFLSFWQSHDGTLLFGNPVSPRYTDNSGKVVQYFEKARFEIGKKGDIVLGLLGRETMSSNQKPVEKPQNFDGLYFGATGHTLAGKFKDFWQANGELQIFGYPISEVLDQNGTKVQYFERARFELAQDANGTLTVKVTPLGEQIWTNLQAKATGD